MKPPLRKGSPDDFQTPPEALYPLLPYIPKSWTIWEPACGEGLMAQTLREKGYNVIATDILTGHDFLRWQPSEHYDIIITNPPYALKNEFLERAYQLNKPFAFLLPLTTLETERRQRLFQTNGIQLLLLPKRINFITPSGQGSGSWFAVAWFTWKLNLPYDLTFALNQKVYILCREIGNGDSNARNNSKVRV